MRKKKVIKHSSMPMRSPVGFAVLYWLLMDRLQAPEWAFGVLWTVVAVGAVAFIGSFWSEERKDVPGFGEQ